jgi:hypothetical protein
MTSSSVSEHLPNWLRATSVELLIVGLALMPGCSHSEKAATFSGYMGSGAGAKQMTMAALEPVAQAAERQVIRTGSMQALSNDPAQSADKVQALVAEFGGVVDRSTINGERQHATSAEMTVRVPASRFDDFRGRIRQLAGRVQQETTEARDVTREATDQQATLQNYQAEEEQYRTLLKRAGTVKDIADVTQKLADVRGRIDRLQADIRFLQQQVQMSQLTLRILAEYTPEATEWHPLHQARQSLRDALSGFTDLADSIFAIIVFIPIALLWIVVSFVLLKLAWIVVRRIGRVFFPHFRLWRRTQQQG